MKVSVYCLVYNHEAYLRSALDGFVNQNTNFDYEVIVHDDASTDSSKEIIEAYASEYPNIIKPIYQAENQYSKGVRIDKVFIFPKLTGEYVAVCEGDDYWTDPLKLQKQVDFLDANPEYSACVHNTIIHNVRTGTKQSMYHHDQDEDISFYDVIPAGSRGYHTSSLMYRSEYNFDRPLFFEIAQGYGDYPLAIYLSLVGKIRFLKETMSVYRLETSGSWSMALFQDTPKAARHNYNVSEMLASVNDYTNNAYKETIDKAILYHTYLALFFEGKYSELRKEPYCQIYQGQPLSYKIKTHLKEKMMPLYHIYRRIKYES